MKLAILAGFAVGTAIVAWTFYRELSRNPARSAKAELQAIEEQRWREFLRKWEAA